MGLLRNLADRFDPPSEQRSLDPSWTALSQLSSGGTVASPRLAENLSTVLACVNAISTAVASLPAWVYQQNGNGRQADHQHAIARLIRRGPNGKQSWPDFIEFIMASTLLRGNGLAEIIIDRSGSPIALKPIPWEWVAVSMLPGGRLAYDISDMSHLYGGTGKTRRLLEGEVLHLKDRSDDGLIGRSRLSRASAVVNNGYAIQDFSQALYENGLYPSGILSVDAHLGVDSSAVLRETFEAKFMGARKGGKVLILDQDLKWQQVSVTPEDAEMLASRRFGTEELARLFQVPPPLVGIWDNSTFTNSETAGRWFAQHTLAPWIRKLESEFSRSVLSESERDTHHIEIDLSGFMRGDYQARWAAHKIAVDSGILDTDEVREVEGWNPRGSKNV